MIGAVGGQSEVAEDGRSSGPSPVPGGAGRRAPLRARGAVAQASLPRPRSRRRPARRGRPGSVAPAVGTFRRRPSSVVST